MFRPRPRRVYITVKNGLFLLQGMGHWLSYWRDPYHLFLVMPWSLFLVGILLIYVLINLFFAGLYLLGGEGIANAEPGSFADAFFFSVQTFASIGYGAMYPQSLYVHTVVACQAVVSLISIALLTGISFARFARPTARVIFSRVAVICKHDGIPTLMIRAVNERGNQILEAQARLTLLRDEITQEGNPFRRMYDLPLVRDRTYSFSIGWTILHPIIPGSPLYGLKSEDLFQRNTTITATIHGLDETVAQTVHAQYDYGSHAILFHHRFVDMIQFLPDQRRLIDFSKIHEVIPEYPTLT
ncbi:MAG: ion channel [Thermostichales cyanobacterium BF4_bins_65]